MRKLSVDVSHIVACSRVNQSVMWLFIQRVFKVNSLSAYLLSVVVSVSYSTRLEATIERYDICMIFERHNVVKPR